MEIENSILQQESCSVSLDSIVKFLNFGIPEIFAVIYLKFKKKRTNLKVFRQKDANGKANSDDPDQTAPLGAV